MEKKALQLASVASMIDQFNMSNIQILLSLGYKVDVLADFTNPGTITNERAQFLAKELESIGVKVINVSIPRTLNPKPIISSYNQVKRIIKSEHYDLIHCHSPIGGAICRLAAKKERKTGTKVIYTAHGFHFYNGAPLKNWLVFYPVEKWLSKYTDVLITINNEDYKRASNKFNAVRTIKIPGVGVDTQKFAICKVDKAAKRKELRLKEEDFVLLSVGELSDRNNHKIVIEALCQMKEKGTIENIVYLLVGRGDLKEEFEKLIKQNQLEEHIMLLGFRTDTDELCEIADCFVHPSIREGLGIAPLEAMAAGLPLISANVNGIKDYTEDGISGCCIDPTDVAEMVRAIEKMHSNEEFRKRCSANNWEKAKTFDIKNTEEIMKNVYGGGYKHLLSILIRQGKRQSLGLDNNDYVILSVGELNENKNHQVMIHAIREVENVKYIVVGRGPLEKQLKVLTRELGVDSRVLFTGYRTDIRDLIWASDCFAFPSKREGLGLAAIEGMAGGLPVVSSGAGGIEDYLINGLTGYVCDGNNSDNYRNIIKKIMIQNTYEMSKKCTEMAYCFDKEKTDSIMRKVYAGK